MGAALAAAALVAAHLLAGGLRFLDVAPRSRWLSAAGGVSVAYVFVHLLPELREAQEAVEREAGGFLPFLEDHVFLVALAGLALFYGVELASRRSGGGGGAFRLSMTSFAVYNAIVGYLLVEREDDGVRDLALFALAMGVHFVVNDHALRAHHREAYARVGRWLLAASVVVGVAVGHAAELSQAGLGLLIAFLGGGVILNVLKEELPEERESRFWAFALGAAAYAALLQAI
jgi:hypothetical protein